MWFNNAMIFQYELDQSIPLAEALTTDALKPCPAHARFVYGWSPIIADTLVHEIAGCALICMGKEERLLPRAVIKKILSERIELLENQQNRPLKRAEKAQMAEELEFELLPKAFCVQKYCFALLDTNKKRLIINSTSTQQASQLTSLLRKSIPSIRIEPITLPNNLTARLTEWITHPSSVPTACTLTENCLLFSPDDEKKRIHCKGYELPAAEVLSLIEQGLSVAEVSLNWQDRIQLTLTNDFVLKRLKCLDYLLDDLHETHQLEEEHAQRDASLALVSGELRGLINTLLDDLSIA